MTAINETPVGSAQKAIAYAYLWADYTDDRDVEGYIGLQHHGEKGLTYRFRKLRIRKPSWYS